ncbi:hypothetical protein F5884DRAFT_851066 [Xylogone sp. PMI_703]|nr:hypothetical protein F5884DRAFT_851066 [Xylogone sp. PMI_703]
MSPQKLFLTGATGYIGGSVLEGIVKKYPDLEISALQRSPSSEFKTRYPQVQIVVGDFDAFDVIEKATIAADIVIHMGDIDHLGCASAILSGLSKKTTPSFLIHLSGTGCIADVSEQTWEGKADPRIWNDIEEIDAIYNLPDSAGHHINDKKIMDASNELVHTAIICPPDIYGQGTGVGNKGTYMVPEYVKVLLEKKEAFYLGAGENYRAVTHINDVVDMFLLLLGEALKGGGKAQWGKEGFYFAVSDEVKWIDAAKAINKLGVEQGWLPAGSKAVSWTKDQVDQSMSWWRPGVALYIWGSNSRAESARAKKLGWVPHGPTFWEALEEDVKIAVQNVRGA